ncbi:hypothetical protein J2810_004613 [Chryseobacterium rhizosphaerae]|uniref:hypothetical protein n=1 Tax=Chryseobacterium rhizosphaerae TaxID=395937 RepID=UPI0028661501|nr:hypothetical protein [Chryseobacterium rhizosphaerae]MDR6548523.1 hypothetical protein [Chryseobacterium rhizosphaerae]
MVEPKDYRVGNKILEDTTIYNYGTTKTYRNIEFSDFAVRDKDWSDHWDMIKPIEITPDWLLKCGFEKYVYRTFEGFLLNFQNYRLVFFQNVMHFGIVDLSFGNVKVMNIKYVHQLQNLFFALTGIEMYIK